MVVHSALPASLTAAADAVLAEGGIAHVAHVDEPALAAAQAAADDSACVGLLGPFRSEDVAHAVEATAPAGLALLAPTATWAGVTRDDEPGCDDPADHRGTVIRLVARDTEVARRLARHVRDAGRRARVIAGPHDYGLQLDGQLRLAGLPRADAEDDADLVVLCGLPDGPEIAEARATAPLPIIAFDAVQGTDLGADREVRLALPFAPGDGDAFDWLTYGAERAGHGARLIAAALADGAHDRPTLLDHLRRAGPFDAHGDPVDPPVWLWRAQPDRSLRPDRAI